MRFRVLGPLRVWNETAWLPIHAAQQRVVLSVLLIESGQLVTTDRLVDEVWGERPPRAAASVVRGYVMRLRRALSSGPEGPLLTRRAGYELAIDDDAVDAKVFRRLVAGARRARAANDLETAVAGLQDALALWRGAGFADVPPGPAVTAYASRLEQDRLAVLEERIGALLELDRHGDVVGELQQLVRDNPLREQLWTQLVLALYRCERRGEALDAYRKARAVLAAELGLEPGRRLREAQRMILSDGAAPNGAVADGPGRRAGPARPVPRQLPPAIPHFVGRAAQREELDRLVPAARAGNGAAIAAISGMAGVGKTALAVAWAHRAAVHFDGGQLYVNLRGFDPDGPAVAAGEALRGFLEALGVPPQQVPAELPAQSALYRSLLAGRRVLVLLDNARDAEQVRPLLPGTAGCAVLVTSRNRLTSLVAAEGAHPLALDVLSPAEAGQLLAGRLGRARTAVEPDVLAEIIDRCGKLPLALAIVAARAAEEASFPLATFAAQLRTAGRRLDALAVTDPGVNIRTVFSWSYRALGTPAAALFPLLGLHPGPDFTATAAASLAGVAVPQVRSSLTQLTAAHLLVEHVPGRYASHDLLHAYAAELGHAIGAADRGAALRRLYDHCLHTLHGAALLLAPSRLWVTPPPALPGTTVDHLAERDQALAWLTAERPVLLALVHHAAATGYDEHAWRLARSCEIIFRLRGRREEWVTVARAGLDAACRRADPAAAAHAHHGLANAYTGLARYDEARTHYRRALAAFRKLGERVAAAQAHLDVSVVFERQGRHRHALRHTERSFRLFRAARDRVGQALALNGIGWQYALCGEYQQTLASCQRALALQQELGDVKGQAHSLDSIGYAYHHLGLHQQAVACYQQALDRFESLGDGYNQGTILIHLGEAEYTAGARELARMAWQRARDILTELNHPLADRVSEKLAQL